MQEKTLQTPRSALREGRPCSRPIEKTMVRKAVPLQPRKDHGVNTFTLQPVEEPHQSRQGGQEEAGAHGKPLLEQAPGRSWG